MRFDGGLGIKAVTTWIPETCETVEYAVRAGLLNASAVGRQGVTALPVSADLAPPQMAVLAGRKALTRARWDSAKIGMLAHAWVYHQGHDKWSPAHYIANELHLPASALPFGIQAMCTGGATGLYLAATGLLADEETSAALVTTAEKYGAPVWDRWTMHPDIGYGDGATAALLHRRDGSSDDLLLLSMTHSSASWLEGMERGDAPFTPSPMLGKDNWDTNDQRKQFYDVHGKDSFGAASRLHVRASLNQALVEAELEADDPRIRFVAVPRMGPRLIELMYLNVVESDLKAEHILLGGRTGHLGSGDMLANMADIVESGMLRPGEIAIIAGAGGGFGWSTAIVEKPGN